MKRAECAVLDKGHPRRLNDAKCAYRKMTDEQREQFHRFMEETLKAEYKEGK
tara:strand:+ start:9482 stop:9637 length:156 start_codon:yes stop_codon:yes gene_type:complete